MLAERTTKVVAPVSVPPVALAPGAVVLLFTTAVAALVHPFEEFVTVTAYVPAELTLGLAVLPPDTIPVPTQLKVVPVAVVTERTTDVVVQVSVPPTALAPGTPLLRLTNAIATLTHPLAVTVTVYVPDELTLGFAVVPPETIPGPDQPKLTPAVDEVADNTTDVVVQVSVPPVALAPGSAPLIPTEAVAVLVHPLAAFVTVSMYVPAAVVSGF